MSSVGSPCALRHAATTYRLRPDIPRPAALCAAGAACGHRRTACARACARARARVPGGDGAAGGGRGGGGGVLPADARGRDRHRGRGHRRAAHGARHHAAVHAAARDAWTSRPRGTGGRNSARLLRVRPPPLCPCAPLRFVRARAVRLAADHTGRCWRHTAHIRPGGGAFSLARAVGGMQPATRRRARCSAPCRARCHRPVSASAGLRRSARLAAQAPAPAPAPARRRVLVLVLVLGRVGRRRRRPRGSTRCWCTRRNACTTGASSSSAS